MWGRSDNQDVGLEAATIQRVRNSSLVERPCAENVPGLKPGAETVGPCLTGAVGERSILALKRARERSLGADGSENVGMSSE